MHFYTEKTDLNSVEKYRVALWAKEFGEELLELGEKMTKSVEIKKVTNGLCLFTSRVCVINYLLFTEIHILQRSCGEQGQ